MLKLASDKYLLRTPLLPVNYAEKAFEGDIRDVAQHKEFMYGIYLSSKSLYEEFIKQLSGNSVTDKMRHSLQKYWCRASSRCTPYANFAGCALGQFTERTEIIVQYPDKHNEACRLDMDLLYRFLHVLYLDEKIKEQISYCPNTTLYNLAGKYRYIRYHFSGKRSYFLSEIEPSFYLKDIISICSNGMPYSKLKEHLLQYCESPEYATAYLDSLVRNQVIVSELEPNISGDEPFRRLATILEKYDHAETYIALIKSITTDLGNNSYSIDRLERIAARVNDHKIGTAVSTMFQCDVNTTFHNNTISKTVINDILDKASEVILMFNAGKGKNEAIENFKKKFFSRYERQTVPLFEALDVENGIAYSSGSGNINPFISDVKFVTEPATLYNPLMELIAKRLNTVQFNYDPIVIKRDDMLKLKKKKSSVRDIQTKYSFDSDQHLYLMGSLYGSNAQAIDEGKYTFWMKVIGGASHATLISRFAHVDKEVGDWVTQLTLSEQDGLPEDTIYAEIIHLPQERLGNISQRPLLRAYEISYLGNSGIAKEHQIPITDLMLTLEKGQLILRSRKHNKRVIPRLTNAHNYSSDSLPIYKFLCDLQYQNSFTGVSFERMMTDNGTFSPRIMYENVILKRAMWRFTKSDFKNEKDIDIKIGCLLQIKQQRQIPDKVVLQQNDNELLIDFTHRDSISIFLHYIEKYEAVQIAEFLGDARNCFIENDLGKFNSEIIIPIKIERDQSESVSVRSAGYRASTVKRTFMPGDEWVYIKLYCSANFADSFIAFDLGKITNRLTKEAWIDKYFFLRYADPDFHLRIRCKLVNKSDFSKVIQIVNSYLDKFIKQRTIKKVQLDTYVRELERYGGRTMELSESIFFSDSQLVSSCINIIHKRGDEKTRWLLALAGIDVYLTDFGYDDDGKLKLTGQLQNIFFHEFGSGQGLLHSLNDKYRNLKGAMFSLFKDDSYSFQYTEYNKIFKVWRNNNALAAQEIRKVYKNDYNKLDDLLMSYIHMFINRLFMSENRKHELALYHLINRYYVSKKAIQKKTMAV